MSISENKPELQESLGVPGRHVLALAPTDVVRNIKDQSALNPKDPFCFYPGFYVEVPVFLAPVEVPGVVIVKCAPQIMCIGASDAAVACIVMIG